MARPSKAGDANVLGRVALTARRNATSLVQDVDGTMTSVNAEKAGSELSLADTDVLETISPTDLLLVVLLSPPV